VQNTAWLCKLCQLENSAAWCWESCCGIQCQNGSSAKINIRSVLSKTWLMCRDFRFRKCLMGALQLWDGYELGKPYFDVMMEGVKCYCGRCDVSILWITLTRDGRECWKEVEAVMNGIDYRTTLSLIGLTTLK
jgi:hypothetical protein